MIGFIDTSLGYVKYDAEPTSTCGYQPYLKR